MFGFGKRKIEVPYEEIGYLYAERLPAMIDMLVDKRIEWMRRSSDPDAMGSELAIVSLAVFQLFLNVHLTEEYASSRVIAGFLARMQLRFENLAFDPATMQIFEEYIKAAANDLRDKTKRESFPTLIPLAVKRVTGLGPIDHSYQTAVAMMYDFAEVVMKGSVEAITEAKKRFKLV